MHMPRNRQQIPKAEREAAVLEQARELFIAKGYRGTRVAEVGRAAGIASAAVHWYFPTKDDLFAAVLEQVFGEAIADVDASDRAARDKLEAFLSKTKGYRVLHRQAYERMEESKALRAVYLGLLQWLEDLLLQAISERVPEGTDTDPIADAAHVLLEGMLISVRELDRPVGDLIDMLIDALVATAAWKSAGDSHGLLRSTR
jgi:AcrR family transcriptional regulator